MTTPTQLTRTCSACGQQKPLSAFLEISSRGTKYGNICAACRGAGKGTTLPDKGSDEHNVLELKLRIGAKERLQKEIDQKRKAEALKQNNIQEQKKRDFLINEKKDSKDRKEQSEKKHREFYLGEKKPVTSKQVIEKIQRDNLFNHTITQEQQTFEEKKLHEDIAQQELKRTTTDFTSPVFSPEQFKIQHHNPLFLQFVTLLGKKRIPLMRTIQQLYDNKPETPTSPEELIEKNWGPSSRKP